MSNMPVLDSSAYDSSDVNYFEINLLHSLH